MVLQVATCVSILWRQWSDKVQLLSLVRCLEISTRQECSQHNSDAAICSSNQVQPVREAGIWCRKPHLDTVPVT